MLLNYRRRDVYYSSGGQSGIDEEADGQWWITQDGQAVLSRQVEEDRRRVYLLRVCDEQHAVNGAHV